MQLVPITTKNTLFDVIATINSSFTLRQLYKLGKHIRRPSRLRTVPFSGLALRTKPLLG